jgi:integrase
MNNIVVYLVKRSRTLPSGRKAQYWVLRWADSRGKMRSESIGKVGPMRKREAEQRRREKEASIGVGQTRRDRPQKMTLKAFLDLDRKAITGDVRGSTLLEHDHAKAHAIAVLGKDADVSKLTYGDVGRIKAQLADNGKSPATISKTLRILRAAFNRGIQVGIVHDNPFRNMRLPRSEGKTKRIFTKAEVDALVRASASLWWKVFIRLAVTSGLRKDELLNLYWDDVDLNAGNVKVQPKSSSTFTVNAATYRTWTWSAKAKASYHTIPLPQETVKLLRRLKLKSDKSRFVFIDLRRVAQIEPHIGKDGKLPAKFDIRPNLLRDFHVLQQAAAKHLNRKLPQNQQVEWRIGCLHDLRRTYCTHMANHVPMHALREWAGHADIATTASFYLGMTDGMAEKARQAWEETG